MFQERVLQEKLKIIFLQNISGRGVFHGVDFSSKFTDSWSTAHFAGYTKSGLKK